jgi:hypothetical protein
MTILQKVLFCAVASLSATTATATLLDDPRVIREAALNLRSDRVSVADFGSTSFADDRIGSVTVTAFGTPSPAASATANIGLSEIPSLFGRGAVSVTYAFEILGLGGDVPILIDAAGSASAFATSGASFAVESSWSLFDGAAFLAGDDIRSGQLGGSFGQSFNHTLGLSLAANHVYSITMLADAAGAATLEGSHAIAEAFIDPVFSFGFGVDPLLYAFHFSSGIGNERDVPTDPGTQVSEPGSLALVCGAFLAVAGFRRRRKGQL